MLCCIIIFFFPISFTAGCFSTLGNNPFDVVKVSHYYLLWKNQYLCIRALKTHFFLFFVLTHVLLFLVDVTMQTRMQGTHSSQYANTVDCFKQIIQNEGVGAFYAGVVPRLGRVVPGQGIIFMSFETIVHSLEKFSIFQ